ncbi:hypothetical protein OIU76_009934 [Salix suchowensis]|nr:hypothetical protein OIU76_009934 [Salix suchowensis]
MCSGSGGSNSQGIINCEDLVSKDGGDYKNEDAMRVRGEVMFVHGLLRQFKLNGNVGRLPLQEASFSLPPSLVFVYAFLSFYSTVFIISYDHTRGKFIMFMLRASG